MKNLREAYEAVHKVEENSLDISKRMLVASLETMAEGILSTTADEAQITQLAELLKPVAVAFSKLPH